jgi:hypothetical protein
MDKEADFKSYAATVAGSDIKQCSAFIEKNFVRASQPWYQCISWYVNRRLHDVDSWQQHCWCGWNLLYVVSVDVRVESVPLTHPLFSFKECHKECKAFYKCFVYRLVCFCGTLTGIEKCSARPVDNANLKTESQNNE